MYPGSNRRSCRSTAGTLLSNRSGAALTLVRPGRPRPVARRGGPRDTPLHGPARRFAIQCRRGCRSCCVDGLDGTFRTWQDEAYSPSPRRTSSRGHIACTRGCAFLDGEGAAEYASDRRSRTKGFPGWIDERDGQPAELAISVRLNEAGEPIEHLPSRHAGRWARSRKRLARLRLAAVRSRLE